MKKKEMGLTNIVGILLVVVAIVSAGGLVYLASEYCTISDTLVSVEAIGTDLRVLHDNSSGQYQVVVTLVMSNPSELDVVVYSIEYLVYADSGTTSLLNDGSCIGGGSSGLANGTVAANSQRNLTVMYLIGPGSLYHQRLEYALADGNSAWMYLGGFALFKLSDYEEVDGRLGMGFGPREVVVNA